MGRVGLQRVGGAGAVLYSVVLVVALILLEATGLLGSSDASEVLPIMEEHRILVVTVGWLFVAAPILLTFAGLGFFAAFRGVGSLSWLALLSFIVGSLLALFRTIIWLAMTYALAPAYADAADAGTSAVAAVGDTRIRFGFIAGDLLGGVLVAGIGVPLISAAVLLTELAPNWVGWLGFPVALSAGWVVVLGSPSGLFEWVHTAGVVGFLLWMIALGVVLWRFPDPPTTGTR